MLVQINSSKFKHVSHTLCQQIVSSDFGRNLLKLKLNNCNIDIAVFAPLTQLEELKLKGCLTGTMPIQNDTFLPHLKKLTTGVCLGRCSSRILLESKRWTLVELHLNWFHIVPGAQRNNFNWEELPKLLPNLNHLSVDFTSTLFELKKLIQIVPLFENLSRLQLPFAMLQTNKKLAWDLEDQLVDNGIQLDFNKQHRASSFPEQSMAVVQDRRLGELTRAQPEREITGMRHRHRQLALLAVQAAETRRELREALMERRRLPIN